MAHPGGRPSKYDEKIANEICSIISNTTLGLAAICKAEHMPNRSTIYEWIAKHPEFSNNYARAKELQMELMAEEIIDIADENANDTLTINKNGRDIDVPNMEYMRRSQIRIDARKWLMSKLMPKKFGDRLDLNHGGQTDNPVNVNMTTNEIKAIADALDKEI